MAPESLQPKRGILRTLMLVFAAVFVIGTLFRLTEAGDLTPASAPADDSMTASGSLDYIYEALASSGYDSSWIASDSDGNAFEITKCIIGRMTGGPPCP